MQRPRRYRPKGDEIFAIQFTGDNVEACAEFMGLRVEFDNDAGFDGRGNDGNLYPSKEMRGEFLCLPYRTSTSPRQSALKGEWIVHLEDGFYALTDEQFNARYTKS